MTVSREDAFVRIVAQLETGGNPEAWGDGGRAAGRFQWHPSAYATWGPKPEEFHGEELSWDAAFECALRKFHKAARAMRPSASDCQIAMAWHLHGQLRFTEWDREYEIAWYRAAESIGLSALRGV